MCPTKGRQASPTPESLGFRLAVVRPAALGGSGFGRLLAAPPPAGGSEQVCSRPHRPLARCSLGWGPEQAGGKGAACCPPCGSPVATATEVGGAGQAERAGGQGRDEKALHGRTKAVCELGRLASGPSGQTER